MPVWRNPASPSERPSRERAVPDDRPKPGRFLPLARATPLYRRSCVWLPEFESDRIARERGGRAGPRSPAEQRRARKQRFPDWPDRLPSTFAGPCKVTRPWEVGTRILANSSAVACENTFTCSAGHPAGLGPIPSARTSRVQRLAGGSCRRLLCPAPSASA